MVKVPISRHAQNNRKHTRSMIENFFGKKSYTLRRVSETLDNFGQLGTRTTTDYPLIGDLQSGQDIDSKILSMGLIEVGDSVFYYYIGGCNVTPAPRDLIIDGNSNWEIIEVFDISALQGSNCHIAFKCKRRVEADDS